MASPKAVAAILAMLYELYPQRPVTDTTATAWHMVLSDVEDADLHRAALTVANQPGRTFMPTVGEIRGALAGASVDAPALAKRIEGLGDYSPQVGWRWPTVNTVRERLGDGVADAYAFAGSRLGSDDATTREIAQRDFTVALKDVVRERGASALLPPHKVPALPNPDREVTANIVAEVSAKLAARSVP